MPQIVMQPRDQPVENARPLGPKLRHKVGITLLGRDLHIEGDQHHPAPDPVIAAMDFRLVVAGNGQLEDRIDQHEILIQGAHEDRLAAGQLLDQPFLQPLARIRLRCPHEAGPDQRHKVRRGIAPAAPVPPRDRLDLGRGRIISHQLGHQIDQDGLAVCPRPVKEGEFLLACKAGHRQGEPSLQKPPHLGRGLNPGQELDKQRASRLWVIVHRHDLGQQLVARMLQHIQLRYGVRGGRAAIILSRFQTESQNPRLRVDIQRRGIEIFQGPGDDCAGLPHQVFQRIAVAGILGMGQAPPDRLVALFLDAVRLFAKRHQKGQPLFIDSIAILTFVQKLRNFLLGRLDLAQKGLIFVIDRHMPDLARDQIGQLVGKAAHRNTIRIRLPDLPGPDEPPDPADPDQIAPEMLHKAQPVAIVVQRKLDTARLGRRFLPVRRRRTGIDAIPARIIPAGTRPRIARGTAHAFRQIDIFRVFHDGANALQPIRHIPVPPERPLPARGHPLHRTAPRGPARSSLSIRAPRGGGKTPARRATRRWE